MFSFFKDRCILSYQNRPDAFILNNDTKFSYNYIIYLSVLFIFILKQKLNTATANEMTIENEMTANEMLRNTKVT